MKAQSAFDENVIVGRDAGEVRVVEIDPACATGQFHIVIHVIGKAGEDLAGENPVILGIILTGEVDLTIHVTGTQAPTDVSAQPAGNEVLEFHVEAVIMTESAFFVSDAGRVGCARIIGADGSGV